MLVVAIAMAALLVCTINNFIFAEVVSFILALVRLASYDTYVAFYHVRDNSNDFKTDGISEGR